MVYSSICLSFLSWRRMTFPGERLCFRGIRSDTSSSWMVVAASPPISRRMGDPGGLLPQAGTSCSCSSSSQLSYLLYPTSSARERKEWALNSCSYLSHVAREGEDFPWFQQRKRSASSTVLLVKRYKVLGCEQLKLKRSWYYQKLITLIS